MGEAEKWRSRSAAMEEECGKLKAILAEQDLILQVQAPPPQNARTRWTMKSYGHEKQFKCRHAAPPDNARTRLLVKLAAHSMAGHEFLNSRVFSLSRPQYAIA